MTNLFNNMCVCVVVYSYSGVYTRQMPKHVKGASEEADLNKAYFFMYRMMDHGTTEIRIQMQRVLATTKKIIIKETQGNRLTKHTKLRCSCHDG